MALASGEFYKADDFTYMWFLLNGGTPPQKLKLLFKIENPLSFVA